MNEAAAEGVPLKTPALLKLMPVGRLAVIVEKVSVPVPPVAEIV